MASSELNCSHRSGQDTRPYLLHFPPFTLNPHSERLEVQVIRHVLINSLADESSVLLTILLLPLGIKLLLSLGWAFLNRLVKSHKSPEQRLT